MDRIVVIFRRFGPYHISRLSVAARYFDLHAIEYAHSDTTYPWEALNGEFGFSRYSIVSQNPAKPADRHLAATRLYSTLSKITPVACALPGWSMSEAVMGLHWCTKNRIPSIVMSASTILDHDRVWWREWIKRQIVSQFSAALVGGTPQYQYLTQLGLSGDRIFSGYDVVDNEYFEMNATKVKRMAEQYRRQYSLPEKYFLVCARFIEKKNLKRLLHAYASFKNNYSNVCSTSRQKNEKYKMPWHLVLMGDGPLRQELEAKIKELEISEYVHLPGFKQYHELPVYYALANAFILASTSEQWGLVVNEAMACGLPVLVSNRCGCAQDLVKDGVNGFTFDPFSIESIAVALHKIAALSDTKLSSMGAESSRIIADWGPERFALGLQQAVACVRARPVLNPPAISRVLTRAMIYI